MLIDLVVISIVAGFSLISGLTMISLMFILPVVAYFA